MQIPPPTVAMRDELQRIGDALSVLALAKLPGAPYATAAMQGCVARLAEAAPKPPPDTAIYKGELSHGGSE